MHKSLLKWILNNDLCQHIFQIWTGWLGWISIISSWHWFCLRLGTVWASSQYLRMLTQIQTCQPLRILRNLYAFSVSNTPLRKPVKNVWKLRILRNFGAIPSISYNLQQLSWPAVNRKLPARQNIDKDLFILRLPSVSASDFAIPSTKAAAEVKSCLVKRRADREPF